MARNYILGGMAATQLQAGKPYFKRVIRIDGRGQTDQQNADNRVPAREDGLTCEIIEQGENQGKINFNGALPKDWGVDGELLMIEFPTTLRSVQVQLEEATQGVRAKIMLTAPNQNTKADGVANEAQPVDEGNFIEIKNTETATISSRTKVIFILIEKYADNSIFTTANNETALTGRSNGTVLDAASILITGVLDHEPKAGGSQASNEPNSIIIDANGVERSLRKIWGASDGIG